MFGQKTFSYYNDRTADLLAYKVRRDKGEFDCLAAHLDAFLENQWRLAEWLEANPEYDHRRISF